MSSPSCVGGNGKSKVDSPTNQQYPMAGKQWAALEARWEPRVGAVILHGQPTISHPDRPDAGTEWTDEVVYAMPIHASWSLETVQRLHAVLGVGPRATFTCAVMDPDSTVGYYRLHQGGGRPPR